MDRPTVVAELKKLIEKEIKSQIASNDEELDIDSFTMMLIITFADLQWGVKLDMDSLDFDAFKSLNTLTDLILQKTTTSGRD